MAFTSMYAERIKGSNIITVNLNYEILQIVFEDICSKLDDMDRKINGVEKGLAFKADEKATNSRFDTIESRIDSLEDNTKLLSDNHASLKQEVTDLLKGAEEKIDSAVAHCLVESGNITRNLIHESEPDIAKNVIASLPNLHALLEDNKFKAQQIEELQRRVDDLEAQRISQEDIDRLKEELKPPPMIIPPPVTTNAGISEEDLSSIYGSVNDANQKIVQQIEQIKKQMQEGDRLLNNDINNLSKKINEKLQGYDIVQDNLTRSNRQLRETQESFQSEAKDKLAKLEKDLEELTSNFNTTSAQLVEKDTELAMADQQALDKIAGLQSSLDSLKQQFDDVNSNVPEPVIVNDDGGIDLGPILKQLRIFESKFSEHQNRIFNLENKEYVHPMAVKNIKDKLDDVAQNFQVSLATLAECRNTANAATDAIHGHDEKFTKVDEEFDKIRNNIQKSFINIDSSQQLIESMQQKLDECERQISELQTNIADLLVRPVAPKAVKMDTTKDNRVDSLLASLNAMEKEVAGLKAGLTGMSSALESVNEKVKTFTSNYQDYSGDMIEIRSELKQLWAKLKELTDMKQETNTDFIPKVELNKPQRMVVERALPRIAVPNTQSPRELRDTVNKVDKQESLIHQLKRAVDTQQRTIMQLDDAKADKAAAQALFEQFRIAMGELNSRLGSLKKALIGKVDAADMNNYLSQMMGSGNADETASSAEPIRCLCCGRPRRNVTGAIDDPEMAKKMAGPVSTRVLGDGEGQVCFVYGERGDMYYGRSSSGKAMYSKAPEVSDSIKSSK